MSEVDWAWVAGLFEGEGWVGLVAAGRGKYRYCYPRLVVDMTDREPLERLHQIAGGYLGAPRQRRANWKPISSWRYQGWDQVTDFYAHISAWLSPRRREQFQKALARMPPAEERGHGSFERAKVHCPNGHPYDEANTWYRSNGWRQCRACARESARRRSGYYERRPA